jgi:cytochrome c peroxidase
MKQRWWGIALAAALLIAATTATIGPSTLAQGNADTLQQIAQALFKPLPEVMQDPNRPFSQELVDLGKMLYYDPRLSLSGVVSCNTCHNLATYGVDNLPTSLGHRWAVGPRNSPTVLNAALHAAQFWDGRAVDVEQQAQGPILNPIEMAMPHADLTTERIASMPGYVAAFAAAFPDASEPITYVNLADAIGAFERTLTTPDRFDLYLAGDAGALSDLEKAGLQVFIDYGCAGCHGGAAMGGSVFARFGIVESYWEATRAFVTIDSPTMPMDVGKFAVTQNPADLYVFKTPSLRNITRTYPYFHDGSVWDLRDATNIMARVQLGQEIDDEDLDALMAFYGALEGTIPAYALALPVLPASSTTTPRPSNR